jgi:glucose/arabinose dehydrogenase
MTVSRRLALLMTTTALLAACGESSKLPPQASVGPNPQLPDPTTSLIPTLKVSKAVGWSGGDAPKAPAGFKVTALAEHLDHPRWVYLLPNGDVLVAESNHPPMPDGATDGGSGPLAWARRTVMGIVMGRVGADAPSANRITLLRDADGDGHAELRTVFQRRCTGQGAVP